MGSKGEEDENVGLVHHVYRCCVVLMVKILNLRQAVKKMLAVILKAIDVMRAREEKVLLLVVVLNTFVRRDITTLRST